MAAMLQVIRLLVTFGFLCFFIGFSIAVSPKSGFLLTAPALFNVNSNETLCLSLHEVSSNGFVNISLKSLINGESLANSSHFIVGGKSECWQIPVPSISLSEVDLHIEGEFEDSRYKIKGTTKVAIAKLSTLTFVQTDKPIYKPGQKVRFRILTVDYNLKPIITPIRKVWIKDPAGIRMAMWSNVVTDSGLADLALQLSDEPTLGKWSIVVQCNHSKEVQEFTVKEYVLPKFSVEIMSPPALFEKQLKLAWTVCAKYTYGQSVDGVLVTTVTFNSGNSQYTSNRSCNLTSFKQDSECFVVEKNGCYDVEIVMEDLSRINKVNIYAEITENGTGTKMNKTQNLHIKRHPFEVALKSQSYFKPGLNFYGKAIVTSVDGKPALNITITFQSEKLKNEGFLIFKGSSNFTTNESGEVDFILEPISSDILDFDLKSELLLDAFYGNGSEEKVVTTHFDRIKQWYSASKSAIQIKPFDTRPSCRDELSIVVEGIFSQNMTGNTVTFYYQVSAKGKLLYQGETKHKILPSINEFEIKLKLEAQMAPVAQFLLYYVCKDGEVISDNKEIKIGNCFNNKVEMAFVEPEVLPGTDASVRISASPHSICALQVVDESVFHLSTNNQLNIETVLVKLRDLETMLSPTYNKAECVPRFPYWRNRDRWSSWTSLTDSRESFKNAKVSVISDLTLVTRPCATVRPSYVTLSFASERHFIPRFQTFGPASSDTDHEYASFSLPASISGSPKFSSAADLESRERSVINVVLPTAVEIRNFFPETWLWELQKIGELGNVTFQRQIPHSITTWTGNTFCTSTNEGLGISLPASIRSFQPFFLTYSMPYSVKNEELVSFKTSIFSYISECFPVMLTIEDSMDFVIEDKKTHTTCLCGKQYTHVFKIRPQIIGKLNITVWARTMFKNGNESVCGDVEIANVRAHDAITKSLLVKAQGFPKEKTDTRMICLQGKEKEIKRYSFELNLPDNVVEGSSHTYVNIVGDIMGQTLTGLDQLVRFPTGCGEQNMVKFVPNIHVLNYLTNTQQLTEDIKQKATEHLKTGYQRQLTYKHLDGSYSAFGKSDKEGSMWLTAFVLKSFAQAKPFIFIDIGKLSSTMDFIKKHQMDDGCFEPTGRLLSKAMQGGLHTEESSEAQSLTTYVVVSLLEAGMNSSDAIIKKAFSCLENKNHFSIYTLAMRTYAAALSGQTELALTNWKELKDKSSRVDDMMFWKVNNDSLKATAVDIEVTSYALLAMISLNDTSDRYLEALSVVRWLVQQRNANGGFVSTQDTVLALQAMTKYASLVNRDEVNVTMKIETDESEDEITVNNDNRLLMQTKKFAHLPTVVEIEGIGTGCILFELTTKYNVHEAAVVKSLDLQVDTDPHEKKLHICTKYLEPDGKSNMAVVEINTLSGYEIIKERLEELKNDVQTQVKRIEINDDGTGILYFDELTSHPTCFDIYTYQTMDVKDVKPAIIDVYDYYQPELHISKEYTFEPLSDKTDLKLRRSRRQANEDTFFEPNYFDNGQYPAAPTITPPLFDRCCPACLQDFPPNFPPVLCNGDIAIIAKVQRNTNLRLKRNVRGTKFTKINRSAKYDIDKSCQCDVLQSGQQVLISGKLPATSNRSEVPTTFVFNSDIYLITMDKKNMKKLRKIHKSCKSKFFDEIIHVET